jgi:hypothetical protein
MVDENTAAFFIREVIAGSSQYRCDGKNPP